RSECHPTTRKRIAPSQLMLLVLLSVAVSSQIVSPKIIQAQLINGLCEKLPVVDVKASNNNINNKNKHEDKSKAVIDNDLARGWAAKGLGSFIQAYLGSIKTICSLGIAWYK